MRGIIAAIALCLLISAVLTACGKSDGAPIPIQDIQVKASYLTEGYDVYKYVAIKRQMDASPDGINALLDYFVDMYGKAGKVKIMVFPDASSAYQAVSERVLAELEMENGEVIRRVVNVH
jgi:predicted small secreted protein